MLPERNAVSTTMLLKMPVQKCSVNVLFKLLNVLHFALLGNLIGILASF